MPRDASLLPLLEAEERSRHGRETALGELPRTLRSRTWSAATAPRRTEVWRGAGFGMSAVVGGHRAAQAGADLVAGGGDVGGQWTGLGRGDVGAQLLGAGAAE